MFTGDEWDDCDDFDVFDLARSLKGKDLPDAEALPQPLTIDEIIDAQKNDDFCQTTIRSIDDKSRFFEDATTGLLKRRHPRDEGLVQVVVPKSLRSRLLHLAHHALPAGHPGQNRMYYTLRRWYYWPHMASDVMHEVRSCGPCAKNRLRLRKHLNRLKLFPATRPLEDVAIDILGPLPKTAGGKEYILLITDRFTKLVAAVPLARITAYAVAVAFCEAWVFKYGAPSTLLSDNGSQFASKLFQTVCQRLGIDNRFTSAYHPQTNGQVERYNRTVLAMLRNYVNEHHDDWDRYISGVTYAYNCTVHRTTKTTPFELVLSRPPPTFTMNHDAHTPRRTSAATKQDFVRRLEDSIVKANASLAKTQARYKRDFDKRVRRANRRLSPGDYVYLDPTDGSKKLGKLQSPAVGPFRVVSNDRRTLVIDRDGIIERVNADRVVHAPPPPDADTVQSTPEFRATADDIAAKNLDGPKYTVERILDHEVRDDGLYLEVKWYGYPRSDWQPRTNIPEELVSRYFDRRRRAVLRRQN